MHKQLKKILSIFLLFLFLFPMVQKELHAYEHKNDFHCNSTDKHIHSIEHTCGICDFAIFDSTLNSSVPFTIITSEKHFLYIEYAENHNFSYCSQQLPPRAPPVA
jgi:hypothetical protein